VWARPSLGCIVRPPSCAEKPRRIAMPSISRHFWPCLRILCEWTNNRQRITYGELANELGLKLAQQEWNTLLDLIAGKTKRELGDDYDLTWIVVYASGPANNLGRYFSNGSKAPGTTLLDPGNMQQRAEYERTLSEVFKYTYELRKVGDVDALVKIPRRRRRSAQLRAAGTASS
jgi:hypothetical protein